MSLSRPRAGDLALVRAATKTGDVAQAIPQLEASERALARENCKIQFRRRQKRSQPHGSFTRTAARIAME